MNRYFFNFRRGNEVSRDSLGMYLPNLEAARVEAMQTCSDLALLAEQLGECDPDCAVEVADASGEPALNIPLNQLLH